MRISLLYIQQNKTRNANDFEDHFLKKLKNNMDINISNIPIKKKFNSKSQQVAYEADLLLEKIGKNNFICFDKIGRKMSSEEFSKDLYKSNEKIFLVIGGAFGLSEEIKKNALK